MNEQNTTPDDGQYLVRNITAKFSLLLMEEADIQIGATSEIAVKTGLSVEATIVHIIHEAGSNFLGACQRIMMPVDPLPGDEPMIQLNLKYFHLREDIEENFTFGCVETVTIKPGELNRAIADASNQAKALFARKLPALLTA
jgi:hypothetical protein